MIAAAVIDEVQGMLRGGQLSQRKIAALVGVSRGTVNAIALRRRSAAGYARRKAHAGFVPPSGRAVRCNGCGGKVQMPCLVCYVRRWSQQNGTKRE